jgi:hypothetical protein
MMKYKRNEVVQLLGSGVCDINFFKLSGEVREMRATRATQFIPKDKLPKDNTVEKDGPIRVFDLDLKEWRSFVLENLTAIDVV